MLAYVVVDQVYTVIYCISIFESNY